MYTLAKAPNPTQAEQSAYGALTCAMEGAVAYYNCNTATLACSRTAWLYGAGGGVSQLFPKPSYQSALNVSGMVTIHGLV